MGEVAPAVTISHYKTAEQFQRYLEKLGVLDIYEEPEKPNSALDFFFLKHHSGAATPENPEIELLCLELEKLKEKYEVIVRENEKLKTKEKIQ